MKNNLKITSILLIVMTTLFLYIYKTRRKTELNEPIDGWGPSSIREVSHYIAPNSSILPNEFCETTSTIMVIVHSNPSNFQARSTIRRTWKQASKSFYFLLGRSENLTLQMEIFDEIRNHQDIIQGDFIDSYNNLTLKSIVMLELATSCADKSLYLLKTDDDTLVNFHKFGEMLYDRIQGDTFIMGELNCNVPPIRDPRSKWYMPLYMYPGKIYPSYISGGAYLMPIEVAPKLYQEALKTPLLHIEDVFVTGLCAKGAGIKLEHSSLFSKKFVLKKGCLLKEVYAVFDLTIEEMRKYYSVMRTYLMRDVCVEVPKYSARRWFFDWVFGVKETLFSFRKACK